MSATRTERGDDRSGVAIWPDAARLAELARRHALPAGVALALGAILRLLWLGDTSFLGDQAELLSLARSAATHHAFILTGIPSSLGALNPPASTWLYAPFALIGGPLAAALFTALANIAAIALLYGIATRYLGARAGFAAALLYATASGPVHYSRFIWQQNLLAPILLLLFWFILRAVVERRRGWLGWSVLLWGIAFQLHPTAAPLLGLIAVALAFTWRDLRRSDIVWAAVAFVGLFGPTVLWESVSHGADLLGLQRLSQGHAIFDTWALTYLFELVAPAPASAFGAGSSYVQIGQALASLDVLLLALLIAAQVWLVGGLIRPWLRQRAGLAAAARQALEDVRWRFALCLALWEALPLAFMLRHTRTVEPHYLLALLPGVYLSIGGFLAWATTQLQLIVTRRSLPESQGRLLASVTLTLVLILVSVAQTVGVSGELATIHSGAFNGRALPLNYGTPLSSELSAVADTQAAAQRLHATIAFASTRVQQEPLGYLNATTGAVPATDYISDGCLVTPAASAHAPLVTLVVPESAAASLLPRLHGAHALASIPVKGGPPYLLYEMSPGATVSGEQAIAIPAASAQAGQPLPVAYAYTPGAKGGVSLTVRWVGAPSLRPDPATAVSYWYGADPRATPIAHYIFTLQPLDAQGQRLGSPLTTRCARLGWSPDLSVITTTPVPTAVSAHQRVAGWQVSAAVELAVATRPAIGPLALETGAITFGPARPLGAPVTVAAPLP